MDQNHNDTSAWAFIGVFCAYVINTKIRCVCPYVHLHSSPIMCALQSENPLSFVVTHFFDKINLCKVLFSNNTGSIDISLV